MLWNRYRVLSKKTWPLRWRVNKSTRYFDYSIITFRAKLLSWPNKSQQTHFMAAVTNDAKLVRCSRYDWDSVTFILNFSSNKKKLNLQSSFEVCCVVPAGGRIFWKAKKTNILFCSERNIQSFDKSIWSHLIPFDSFDGSFGFCIAICYACELAQPSQIQRNDEKWFSPDTFASDRTQEVLDVANVRYNVLHCEHISNGSRLAKNGAMRAILWEFMQKKSIWCTRRLDATIIFGNLSSNVMISGS